LKITADTNILVRAVIQDDLDQASLAIEALLKAQTVVLTSMALCEFVWVAARAYRLPPPEISAAIRTLLASENVEADWPIVEAGLAMLDSGGDFADGVIALEGRRQGAEVFLSFDRKAVRELQAQGEVAQLLG
jgi:predicted nucleic-acid-binding protein